MQSHKTITLTLAVAASLALAGCASDNHSRRSAGTVIDDATITASVKTQLIGDTDTKAHQINVETSDGVVQLNGFVDSSNARSEAQRIAAATDGVKQVRNNLAVRTDDRSTGGVVDDAVVTAKVDAALAGDNRTNALQLDVETREGEVQLSGFAKSAAERDAAAEIARSVNGVRMVKNAIQVR